MKGLMQDWQLTVDKVLDHAARNHGDREIVTRNVEGDIVRTTYAELRERAKQVSSALLDEGIQLGDRVATLAWNTWRHYEVYYATAGIGSPRRAASAAATLRKLNRGQVAASAARMAATRSAGTARRMSTRRAIWLRGSRSE